MRSRPSGVASLPALGFALLLATAPARASDVELDEPLPDEALENAIPDVPEDDLPDAGTTKGAASPDAYVARSVVTTAVVGREPTDAVETLSNDHVEAAFFTEVRDMSGSRLVHRWEYGGRVVAEVPFEIGGPRWRVHSRKQLDPEWVGEWTVSAVDPSGRVLATEHFRYVEAASGTADAPAPPPDEPTSPAAPAD